MEFKKQSDARWACRDRALKAFQSILKAVMKLLDDISESYPLNLAQGDVKMYRKSINFIFILCLEITAQVFQVTAPASDTLQEESPDHSTAYISTIQF
eukprot:superscaffoldBa00002018_g12892